MSTFHATEAAAAKAGREHFQPAGEFVTAEMPGGGYDFFPAGHPVGWHDTDGRFQRGGEIVARYRRTAGGSWRKARDV